jgi:hypothetical protein
MKGVLITAINQASLGHQYRVDPDDLDDMLPLGYILLADFGGEWYEGIITQTKFDTLYLKGDTLENDYFVVIHQ